MKSLPPSMRPSYRYLKFRVHAEEKVELGDIVEAVWKAVLDYLGKEGTSKTGLWIMGNKFDRERQEGIIRTRRETEDDVRAALLLMESISGKTGFLEIQKVSGGLNSLEE